MPFEYQAYRNPYVGTIAELLSRGEDAKAKALIDVANAQAQAAQVRGQAWGGAIEGIGQIAAKAITDYNDPKARQQRELDRGQAILKARGQEQQLNDRQRVMLGEVVPARTDVEYRQRPVDDGMSRPFGNIQFGASRGPNVSTSETFALGVPSPDGSTIENPSSMSPVGNATVQRGLARADAFGLNPQPDTQDGRMSQLLQGSLGTSEVRQVPASRTPSRVETVTGPSVGRYTTPEGLYDVPKAYDDLIRAGISQQVATALAGQGQQANSIFDAFDKQKQAYGKSQVAVHGAIANMALQLADAQPGLSLEEALQSVIGPAGKRVDPKDIDALGVAMFGKSEAEKRQMLESLVKQWDDQSPLRVVGRGDVVQGISGTARGKGQSFPEPKTTPGDVEVEGYRKYVAEGGTLSIGAYRAQETAKASSAGDIERFVTNAITTATEKNNGVPLTPAQENAVTVAAKRQFVLSNADPNVAADIALRREQIIEEGKRGLATPEGKWGSLASDLTYGLDSVDTKSFTNRFNKIGKDDKPGDAAALARSENNQRTMIRAAAMKSMGEAKSKQITSREMAASQLRELRSALAELPKGTNIITGLTEEGLQKLGTSGNQKYVEVMARANTALNAYTNAISGAQFGEDEALRYRQLFPKLTNTVANNLTLIDTMISLSKADEFSQWNSLAGNNPDGVNWLLNRSSARF